LLSARDANTANADGRILSTTIERQRSDHMHDMADNTLSISVHAAAAYARELSPSGPSALAHSAKSSRLSRSAASSSIALPKRGFVWAGRSNFPIGEIGPQPPASEQVTGTHEVPPPE